MALASPITAKTPIHVGFNEPGRDSQIVFRAVLDVMANPGRVSSLPVLVQGSERLGPAAAAVCLALADYETPLWLDGTLASPGVAGFLRFHGGAPMAAGPETADFAVLDGASTPLGRFKTGSDAYPEEGATVIIQVSDLSTNGALTLSGPGIDGERELGIVGIPETFWSERQEITRGFPRGLDLIFCAGHLITALPRTTKVTLAA
jgi:alpha-D-ribose 1-methylphosphonate 5-triphosphate synthase subunit PhnH